MPWDWRILLNGKGDELMFERHRSSPAACLCRAESASLIDARARAANDAPDFSKLIREGLPGMLQADEDF